MISVSVEHTKISLKLKLCLAAIMEKVGEFIHFQVEKKFKYKKVENFRTNIFVIVFFNLSVSNLEAKMCSYCFYLTTFIAKCSVKLCSNELNNTNFLNFLYLNFPSICSSKVAKGRIV